MRRKFNLTFLLIASIFQFGDAFSMEESDNYTEKVIGDLLSLKFTYIGYKLAEKIEEFKGQEDFVSLSNESISRVLEAGRVKITLSHPSAGDKVLVHVPYETRDKKYKDYLVSCAYYPWELDSGKFIFSQTCGLEHIHAQLAYALYYGHPSAALEINKIFKAYYLPRHHRIYHIIEKKLNKREKLKDFTVFVKCEIKGTYNDDELDLSMKPKEIQIRHLDNLTSIIEKGKSIEGTFCSYETII